MGKTQSKRSVDITTDSKKACEDEVTEKMEKIEDIDQKVMNGDAAIQEKVNSEVYYLLHLLFISVIAKHI